MKRTYETVVIYDGTLSDEALAKEHGAFEEFLKGNAEPVRVDQWGKKTLAYEISKRKVGIYYLYVFNAESDISEKIEKLFKLNTKILRTMTVLFEEVKEIAPEALVPAAESEEREESRGWKK